MPPEDDVPAQGTPENSPNPAVDKEPVKAPDPGTTPTPVPAVPSLDAPPKPAEVNVPKTDNAVINLAYKFFAKNGVNEDAFKAAESGDFSKVKEALKTNPDAAEYIAAAESAHKAAASEQANRSSAIQQIVEAAAGGADQWKAARDWAAAEASESQRAEINAALRAGGLQAKLAAQFIVGQYAKRKAASAPVVQAHAAGAPAVNTAPLSPAEFQREVARLTEKHGGRFAFDQPEYKALEARRSAYRGR